MVDGPSPAAGAIRAKQLEGLPLSRTWDITSGWVSAWQPQMGYGQGS
jgi:hypothetical protein